MSIAFVCNSDHPGDICNALHAKLCLLSDLISLANATVGSHLELSPQGSEGLCWILREIEADLGAVLSRLRGLPLEV